MTDEGFLAASANTRIRALLDQGTWSPNEGAYGAMQFGSGAIAGIPITLAVTDPRQASGAIGQIEAIGFQTAISDAQERHRPLVMVLDSAGAKLTDGVPVLGSFRRLERALLDAIDADTRCLAVMGKHCFGGASLLAFACESRVYPQGALVGLSGPRALAAVSESGDGDVESLYGSNSRQHVDADGHFSLNESSSVRAALTYAVSQPATWDSLQTRHSALRSRLRAVRWSNDQTTTVESTWQRNLIGHLDVSKLSVRRNGFAHGVSRVKGSVVTVAGFVAEVPVGAEACWQLADALLQESAENATPLLLLLDAPGQIADIQQEQVLLSEYLAHLARVIRAQQAKGRRIDLLLCGAAGGAIYVVLAAAVREVFALPDARLQTLPTRAVEGVLGKTLDDHADDTTWVEHGVIDAFGFPNFG